ncbi:amidohydrolase [Litoribacter alkaliphilus]|uniref:Amidohydrolase n=1 Tax=Litoribacter ruber TaxID=702568 RepID=A0AAP2CGZ5_9BACT|nr:amidohydrolase [Litoribacter alkaliphilus]MBS9523409.1 amidohydrolase [Litoribacter alkaliphilus]
MKYLFILIGCLTMVGYHTQAQTQESYLEEIFPEIEELYKHFHQYPELSLQEEKTAAKIAEELKNLGFEVTEGIGGHGVVGIFENGEGPTLLVRTDMDALPLEEKTGLPYASKQKGVTGDGKETFIMQACGHDVHMSVFLGTARMLMNFKNEWQGTLMMIGQPAEENGLGAYNMLNDGLFERFPYPDYAIALHDTPHLPAGSIGYKAGPLMAGVDMMNVKVHGEGGHGAAPHMTIDPVVMSAQMIQAYQSIVSRRIAPTEPAVVSVGSIRGGHVHNIIPDEVEMQLTLRYYNPEIRETLIENIKKISEHVARSAGMPEDKLPTYWIREPYTPPLINDDELTELMVGVFKANFEENKIVEIEAEMIGEDFSRYGIQEPAVPISMFFLGATPNDLFKQAKENGKEIPGLHSPLFAPEVEPTLKTGIKAMSLFAMEIFNSTR